MGCDQHISLDRLIQDVELLTRFVGENHKLTALKNLMEERVNQLDVTALPIKPCADGCYEKKTNIL